MQKKFRHIAVSALIGLLTLIAGCMYPSGTSTEMLAPWVKEEYTKWTPTVVLFDAKETGEHTWYVKVPRQFLFFSWHGWKKLDANYAQMMDQDTMLLGYKEGPPKLMRRNDMEARPICSSIANITGRPGMGGAQTFDCTEFGRGFMQFTRRDFHGKILLEMTISLKKTGAYLVDTTIPVFLYDDSGQPYFLQTSITPRDSRGQFKLRFCRVVTMIDDKLTVYLPEETETERTVLSCHEKRQWELATGRKMIEPLDYSKIRAGR